MKSILVAATAALMLTTAGAATNGGSDIRVSTDPARIAAIEQHAKELKARETAAPGASAGATSGKHASTHKHAPQHKSGAPKPAKS